LQRSKKFLIGVGTATCGRSAGALEMLETFHQEIRNHNIEANVIEVGCLELCCVEPLVSIVKIGRPRPWFGNVTSARTRELVNTYLLNGNLVVDYVLGTTEGSVEMSKLLNVFRSVYLKEVKADE